MSVHNVFTSRTIEYYLMAYLKYLKGRSHSVLSKKVYNQNQNQKRIRQETLIMKEDNF